MARITAGFDGSDVHAAAPHVRDRRGYQESPNPTTLVVGIDRNDVDDAHPLMEGVQNHGREPDWAVADGRDEDIAGIAFSGHERVVGLASFETPR